jgi:hypothetical protein
MREITDQLRAHAARMDADHRVPDPMELRRRAERAPASELLRPVGPAPGRAGRLLAAAAVAVLVAGIGAYVRANVGDPVSVGGTSAPAAVPAADGLVRAGALPAEERATGSQALDSSNPTWQFGAYRPEDADRRVITRDAAVAAVRRSAAPYLAGATPASVRLGHLYEIAGWLEARGAARLVGDTPAWLVTLEGVPDPPREGEVCRPVAHLCVTEHGAPGTAYVPVDAVTGDILLVFRWGPPHG